MQTAAAAHVGLASVSPRHHRAGMHGTLARHRERRSSANSRALNSRTVPRDIWFLVDADTLYLTTMNMKRQWTQNVKVNRDVAIRIGPETFVGEASVITEPLEMARVVGLLKKKYWTGR
jgi:hypothetical protein